MVRDRVFFVVLAFLIFLSDLCFSESNISAVDFFNLIRRESLVKLPDQFTCTMSSKTIAKKMESIPSDSILDKKSRPYVQFGYSKASGVQILVQNVEDLYRDLYKDLTRQFFAIDLLLAARNQQTNTRYEISWLNPGDEVKILKLNIPSAQNNLLVYYNIKNKQVFRVDYRLGNQVASSSIIAYQVITSSNKSYEIPVRFLTKVFKNNAEQLPETLEFSNFKIKD